MVTGAITNEFVSTIGEVFGDVGALRSGLGGALMGLEFWMDSGSK